MSKREGTTLPNACMFDIMQLPEETLKRVLPKVSLRMVSRLITSYPRAIGRTLLTIMSQSMSPCTIDLLREEMESSRLLSIHQIQEAEKEFLRTLTTEKILPATSNVNS
jgi:hypothetical protein